MLMTQALDHPVLILKVFKLPCKSSKCLPRAYRNCFLSVIQPLATFVHTSHNFLQLPFFSLQKQRRLFSLTSQYAVRTTGFFGL